MRPGRRSTRSSPTNHPASRPVGLASARDAAPRSGARTRRGSSPEELLLVLGDHRSALRCDRRGAGREDVAVDRGDGVGGEHEHAPEQALHLAHECTRVGAGREPVEVEAVGEELGFAGHNQRERTLDLLEVVQGVVPRGDGGTVEAVLAVAPVQDANVAMGLQVQHGSTLGRARWWQLAGAPGVRRRSVGRVGTVAAIERHLATVWESVADAIGDSSAIVHGMTRRTWSELDDRASRLVAAFAGAGVGPGAAVANYLYNAPEYLESYWAALKHRCVPVNVNYRYLDEELLYLLDNSEAQVLVFHSSLALRVERIADRARSLRLLIEVADAPGHADGASSPLTGVGQPYEQLIAAHGPARRITRDPDDITMLYTGGTTGMPKGVMSRVGPTLDGFMAAVPPAAGLDPVSDPSGVAPAARRLADERRSLVALPVCPLMHATGLSIGTLPMLTFGSCTVLLPGHTFDPQATWATIERERVRAVTVVGDAFARPLLDALHDGPTRDLFALRLVMSSGAMFSTEVKSGLLEHLRRAAIVDYIAATEGGMGASISTHGSPAPTGRFTPNPNVKVLREDGSEVVPGSGEPCLLYTS